MLELKCYVTSYITVQHSDFTSRNCCTPVILQKFRVMLSHAAKLLQHGSFLLGQRRIESHISGGSPELLQQLELCAVLQFPSFEIAP